MAIGKLLATIGVTLLVIGLIITYAPWLISWFGKLPGDIRIEDEKKWLFIPLTSMFIVSIILTILINLFFRKWGDFSLLSKGMTAYFTPQFSPFLTYTFQIFKLIFVSYCFMYDLILQNPENL